LRERIESYMLKAVREAKTHTSWANENREYEDALVSFVRGLLLPDSGANAPFLAGVQQLVTRVARCGFWNSLSRTLIQCTAPGTPDLYQGDELWNFALVDPDNRRPVDYQQRQRLLDEVITGGEGSEGSRREFVRQLVASPEDGRVKLHIVHCALAARREHGDLFAQGDYVPLQAIGPKAAHLFAFARLAGQQAAVVICPRLTASLVPDTHEPPTGAAVWNDTALWLPDRLQGRHWTSLLTRETLSETFADSTSLNVGSALASFPVELFFSTDKES
jgi:(1->4)-alpha-D-glucan 1-alpha-D-glucosylmutase